MMNPNSFSILGYLSVLLWLAVPLLWLLRRRIKTPGWLPLALAVLAFALATSNSRSHVNRIQAEVAEVSPDALMQEAAKRKAVEEAREGEVADIRFAEDGAEDFIDKAGMDDADVYQVTTAGLAPKAWAADLQRVQPTRMLIQAQVSSTVQALRDLAVEALAARSCVGAVREQVRGKFDGAFSAGLRAAG